MYEVDDRDRVVRLDDLPQCDVGAPLPTIVAAEHHLELGFIARTEDPEASELIVVATFTRPYAHMFGAAQRRSVRRPPVRAAWARAVRRLPNRKLVLDPPSSNG